MSTTNLQLIHDVLKSPSDDSVQALLDDEGTTLWIDWRDEDAEISGCFETILQTGVLSSELVEVDTENGFEIYIHYKDKRLKVPLTYSEEDRHVTICSLNEILKPDYEVRLVKASAGSDTLAFVPLPTATWAELEKQYGPAVQAHFYKIAPTPNPFLNPEPF